MKTGEYVPTWSKIRKNENVIYKSSLGRIDSFYNGKTWNRKKYTFANVTDFARTQMGNFEPSKAIFIPWFFCQRGVSSVPFGIPFRLPVLFYNRSSSQFIICKRWVQKDFSIISASFRNLFVVIFTWKRM